MKVAHVVRQYAPSIGGLETAVATLARAQAATAGCNIRIVTLDRLFTRRERRLPAHEVVDGLDVIRIPFSGSSRYPIAPGCLRAIWNVDIVHVHGIDFFFDFLALTRPVHRRPLIASTHGGFFHTSFARSAKELYFRTVTRASSAAYATIIGNSRNDADRFSRLAPARTVLVENPVDCTFFRDRGSPTPRPCLIYFGRLTKHKRIDETIRLLAQLRAASADWTLIIAGREYDLSASDLMDVARRHAVAEFVTIVPGPDQATLLRLIGQASYFVCLSAFEGFGVAAVEAASAGLMPVLSDIPPFRQVIERSGVGIVADTGRLEATAEALTAFRQQVEPRQLSAIRSRLRAYADTFAPEKITRHVLASYEQALAGSTRKASGAVHRSAGPGAASRSRSALARPQQLQTPAREPHA